MMEGMSLTASCCVLSGKAAYTNLSLWLYLTVTRTHDLPQLG